MGARDMLQTPLRITNCPTRRRVMLYPCGSTPYNSAPLPASNRNVVRSDYAFSAGQQGCNEVFAGPADLATGDSWEDCMNPGGGVCGGGCPGGVAGVTYWPYMRKHDGLSFQRSEIRPAHVRDGDMCTFMVGERYIRPENYYTGGDGADNENMYTGYNNDNFRRALQKPARDQLGRYDTFYFGSAHPAGCNFVFCDGRVKKISYEIDDFIFQCLGNRADGQNIDLTKF
jgi:prepilin-type processing-associated H-X9-DG protein